MSVPEYVQACVDAYAQILEIAIPITGFIACCNIGINVLVSAFIGKRIHFGGE